MTRHVLAALFPAALVTEPLIPGAVPHAFAQTASASAVRRARSSAVTVGSAWVGQTADWSRSAWGVLLERADARRLIWPV